MKKVRHKRICTGSFYLHGVQEQAKIALKLQMSQDWLLCGGGQIGKEPKGTFWCWKCSVS